MQSEVCLCWVETVSLIAKCSLKNITCCILYSRGTNWSKQHDVGQCKECKCSGRLLSRITSQHYVSWLVTPTLKVCNCESIHRNRFIVTRLDGSSRNWVYAQRSQMSLQTSIYFANVIRHKYALACAHICFRHWWNILHVITDQWRLWLLAIQVKCAWCALYLLVLSAAAFKKCFYFILMQKRALSTASSSSSTESIFLLGFALFDCRMIRTCSMTLLLIILSRDFFLLYLFLLFIPSLCNKMILFLLVTFSIIFRLSFLVRYFILHVRIHMCAYILIFACHRHDCRLLLLVSFRVAFTSIGLINRIFCFLR